MEEAKRLMEESLEVVPMSDDPPSDHSDASLPRPWLCTCFSGKNISALLSFLASRLEQDTSCSLNMRDVLFWSTKSLVQPVGTLSLDERDEFREDGCHNLGKSEMGRWIVEGGIKGEGCYQHVVKKVL